MLVTESRLYGYGPKNESNTRIMLAISIPIVFAIAAGVRVPTAAIAAPESK